MSPGILIIDKDQRSNEHLRGLLHPRFEVNAAPTVEEGADLLSRISFDMLISDFGMLCSPDTSAALRLRAIQPALPLCLISSNDTERYLSTLIKLSCYHVLPRLPYYNAREVLTFVENILDPRNAFGLPRYLSDDADWDRRKITTRQEKNQTIEEIINFFAMNEYEIHELYDVRLIMEEIINNALFHAFRNPDGSEKYQPGSFEFLDNNEEVAIEFGSDATTIGFSVTDNRGILTPELVIGKLARQYYREGLFDESGRGVYLARMLSGNMVINIHRGRRTQMICIFYEKRLNIPRPFSINYCE